MTTQRLYLADPLLLSFTARVTGHGSIGGRPAVVLDRSAFYPESGGQLADRGRLGEAEVVDVQVGGDGVVQHVVDGAAPAIGAEVEGRVEARRRRRHMAQHTAQHALSAALTAIAAAPTVSSRLGEAACTIDVARRDVPPELIARSADAVNDLVDDDVPVRCVVVGPDEAAQRPLRRSPKVTGDVRLVEIQGFDLVPCGGTHCVTTGQVGLVTVLGAERYKGLTRVTFAAGGPARSLARAHHAALLGLGRELSCGALDVPAAVARLRRDRDAAAAALRAVREGAASRIAAALLERPELVVVATLGDADVELLRATARRVAERRGRAAALACPAEGGTAFVVTRAPGSPVDCGALARALAAAAGGRGGGRTDHAEGRLPGGADFAALVAAALPRGE
jgi:alanyl-tRNA synthetase